MAFSSVNPIVIEPQHQAETSAQRRADQTLTRGCADGGELRDRHGVRARAGSGSDQDVHAEILERRVQHFFDIGKQPVDFVDEEDLARANVGEDAGEIELLLQVSGRRFARSQRPTHRQ